MMFRIAQNDAIALEHEDRRLYGRDWAGISGMTDVDYFEENPTNTVFKDSGIVKYSFWAMISAVLVVLLCCVMRACEKIVEAISQKNKTTIL